MFLSEVEHKSFCVKFLLVLFANLKSSKNHIKIRKYSTCRLIFGLFLKLKKLWRANEAFRIVLLQRHKKSRCVIIFLSSMQKKKNSSRQMRQISGRMEMIHPTIGWRRDEHGTHKHAHGSWILWSVSRVRSKTMYSMFCVTSWLSYITLCYIDSRFFCPWNNRSKLY